MDVEIASTVGAHFLNEKVAKTSKIHESSS